MCPELLIEQRIHNTAIEILSGSEEIVKGATAASRCMPGGPGVGIN